MAKKQNKKAKRATSAKKRTPKQVSKVVEDKKTNDVVQKIEDKSSSPQQKEIVEEKEVISSEITNKIEEVKTEEKQIVEIKQKQEKKEEKKENKKIEQTIEIHAIGDEKITKTSLIDLFIKPKKYISSLRNQDKSLSSNLVYIFIKHAISVIGIVFFLTSLLNESAFSIARLNFTQATYLWLRITIFLFIAEIISSYVFSFIFKKKENINSLFFYSHQTGLIVMILMNLVGIVFFFNQFFGLILFCLIFIDLIYIKSSIFQKVFDLKDDAILWGTELYYFLFVLCFLVCAVLFLNDLSVIVNSLI